MTASNTGDGERVREIAQFERDPEAPGEAELTVSFIVKPGSGG
jgi:hypothetical protein